MGGSQFFDQLAGNVTGGTRNDAMRMGLDVDLGN